MHLRSFWDQLCAVCLQRGALSVQKGEKWGVRVFWCELCPAGPQGHPSPVGQELQKPDPEARRVKNPHRRSNPPCCWGVQPAQLQHLSFLLVLVSSVQKPPHPPAAGLGFSERHHQGVRGCCEHHHGVCHLCFVPMVCDTCPASPCCVTPLLCPYSV